jgi:hypothetical protein
MPIQRWRARSAGLAEACDLIKKSPTRVAEIYLKSKSVALRVDEVEKIITDGSIICKTG